MTCRGFDFLHENHSILADGYCYGLPLAYFLQIERPDGFVALGYLDGFAVLGLLGDFVALDYSDGFAVLGLLGDSVALDYSDGFAVLDCSDDFVVLGCLGGFVALDYSDGFVVLGLLGDFVALDCYDSLGYSLDYDFLGYLVCYFLDCSCALLVLDQQDGYCFA